MLQFRLSSEYIGPKLLYLAYKKTGFLCDSRFSLELFLLIIHDLSVRFMENSYEDKTVSDASFWRQTHLSFFKDDYDSLR